MTTSPGGTPAPRGRRRARLTPTALSGLAVLISVVALVVAVLAYARGGDGSDTAGRQVPAAPSTTSAPTGTSAATSLPTDESTDESAEETLSGTDGALPSGGAPYTVVRQDIPVTLKGGLSVERSLDLDQPQVNADSTRSDVTFSTYEDPPVLKFASTAVATTRAQAVTPDECASNIQLSPTDQEVELSQELVLCTVTNGVGAVNEPSRPKMARIVVNAVSRDGTATLTITTWEIPR
jgi:hypothetical protein